MAEDKKAIITIDDKDYTVDDLTEKQRVIVTHIDSLQQKINSAKFNLDQLSVGQDAFVKMLKEDLNNEEAEEVPETKQ